MQIGQWPQGTISVEQFAQHGQELAEEARKAGLAIDNFSKVNDLIRDPLSEKHEFKNIYEANYELNNRALLDAVLAGQGKGTKINTVV